jgi:hypothetical protein
VEVVDSGCLQIIQKIYCLPKGSTTSGATGGGGGGSVKDAAELRGEQSHGEMEEEEEILLQDQEVSQVVLVNVVS